VKNVINNYPSPNWIILELLRPVQVESNYVVKNVMNKCIFVLIATCTHSSGTLVLGCLLRLGVVWELGVCFPQYHHSYEWLALWSFLE